MAKRVEVHIPHEVWSELRRVAAEHGTNTKRLARAIMLRSLERAAGVDRAITDSLEAS